MQASSSIETIILKSRNTIDRFDSAGNDSMIGNRNGFYKELDDAMKTPNFSSKLLNAVVVFISKSVNLHSVIVDSVQMPTDFISGLGEALSTSRSSKWCSPTPTHLSREFEMLSGTFIVRLLSFTIVAHFYRTLDDFCDSKCSIGQALILILIAPYLHSCPLVII